MKTLATMLVAAVLCTGCVGSLLESGNEAPEVYRLAGASLLHPGVDQGGDLARDAR